MNYKEVARSMRPLTLREQKWVDNFHANETPSSLVFADDFMNLLEPDDIVLDIGCADGRETNMLADMKGVVVIGIDINPSAINEAKQNCPNPRAHYEVMDGAQLEYPSNSFDVVTAAGVIGGDEPEIREDIAKQAFNVLKSGGIFAIAEFKYNPARSEKYEKSEEHGTKFIRMGGKKDGKVLIIVKHFTEDELRKLLSDAGFVDIQIVEHEVESAGIGDGLVEKRKQFTAWGIKPVACVTLL